jgi:hypothetical protein
LYVNGSLSSNQSVIKENVVQFYESLFLEFYNWRPRLDSLAFDSLVAEEAYGLEFPFEEREELEVVKRYG